MRFITIFIIMMLTGCGALNPMHSQTMSDAKALSSKAYEQGHVCQLPRPIICTREFQPVCAQHNNNEKPKTYATGCTACSNSKVDSYVAGPCKTTGEK